jgi:hypothetical protein
LLSQTHVDPTHPGGGVGFAGQLSSADIAVVEPKTDNTKMAITMIVFMFPPKTLPKYITVFSY